MNYYRHLDRSLVQFDFLYLDEKKETHQQEIQALGGRTFFISYPTFKTSDQMKLRNFFAEHKGEFSAVHCHPIWASEIVARAAKKNGIGHIIQHSHSTKYSDSKKSEIRNRILLKFVGCFATDFIACSPEAAKLFGNRRASTGNVLILPNAIELEHYVYNEAQRIDIRSKFHCTPRTLLVGNIGRLWPQKNQTFVLEIFKEIHKLIPDSKLLIVGEGKLRAQLEQEILSNHLFDSVVLTGMQKDIQAILSGLDIFLMPSLFEGAPVSAIEARTSGLPCLVSDTITKSIAMDGVKYLSLKQSACDWAKAAVDFYQSRTGFDRHDNSAVVKQGFDIQSQAKKLCAYYLHIERGASIG